MKQTTKIALAVAAGAAALLLKKTRSVDGVGDINIPYAKAEKTRRLFAAYDHACIVERAQSAKADKILDELEAQGVDISTDEGEAIAAKALFEAGLSDENGETDVYKNRINARLELLNYILYDLLPALPMIPRSDLRQLQETRNITYQNKAIEIVRKLINA